MSSTANYYTATELAGELGCSKSHIYTQVNQGLLPHVKVGTAVRFPKKAILEFFEQQWQSSLNTAMEGGISTLPTDEADGAKEFQHALAKLD